LPLADAQLKGEALRRDRDTEVARYPSGSVVYTIDDGGEHNACDGPDSQGVTGSEDEAYDPRCSYPCAGRYAGKVLGAPIGIEVCVIPRRATIPLEHGSRLDLSCGINYI
jgi:hypothetical protein